MGINKIIRLYENNAVSLCGLRGKGKDMLMSNVIIRRNKPYISNINYGGQYIPLDIKKLDIGNDYRNFISGKINPYVYPYPVKADIYISDSAIYMPNYECNNLNKELRGFVPTNQIIRHLSLGSAIHFNTQCLMRMWDKIREQSETYIRANKCIYLGKYIKPLKLVIQKVTIYDNFDSCENNVKPFPKLGIFDAIKVDKLTYTLMKMSYTATHGKIKPMWLVYWNKSTYDTHHFKTLLEGAKNEK